MLIELAFMCVYGAFMYVRPARPRWTSSSSWGRKQVVLHQISDAVAPGFIGVAANVDAVDKRQFPGRDVGHVDVDVEDEVRDLLDHDPCGGIGAERFAVAELAAAAGADLRTGADLGRRIRGYRDERIPAGGFELGLEEGRDQGKA